VGLRRRLGGEVGRKYRPRRRAPPSGGAVGGPGAGGRRAGGAAPRDGLTARARGADHSVRAVGDHGKPAWHKRPKPAARAWTGRSAGRGSTIRHPIAGRESSRRPPRRRGTHGKGAVLSTRPFPLCLVFASPGPPSSERPRLQIRPRRLRLPAAVAAAAPLAGPAALAGRVAATADARLAARPLAAGDADAAPAAPARDADVVLAGLAFDAILGRAAAFFARPVDADLVDLAVVVDAAGAVVVRGADVVDAGLVGGAVAGGAAARLAGPSRGRSRRPRSGVAAAPRLALAADTDVAERAVAVAVAAAVIVRGRRSP
jgi:hypothetical protein